jgi:hypothetical protein
VGTSGAGEIAWAEVEGLIGEQSESEGFLRVDWNTEMGRLHHLDAIVPVKLAQR